MSAKPPYAEPDPAGSERARKARDFRNLASEISRLHPQAATRNNGEETDHSDYYPANFTKGLLHDTNGLLVYGEDYLCFVEAINSPDPTRFEKHVDSAADHEVTFRCTVDGAGDVKWRGWESPRCGHVYELEGPDAGAVGMAPAPRVGSSELAAEMAEVYGLALLRDVPFTKICSGGNEKLCDGKGKSAPLSCPPQKWSTHSTACRSTPAAIASHPHRTTLTTRSSTTSSATVASVARCHPTACSPRKPCSAARRRAPRSARTSPSSC